jgi:hypothetical protein
MMSDKTKAELSKMTKKNLLLHIENMQLMIENDHLEAQKANREMRDIISSISDPDIGKIQKAAGIMRYQVSQYKFESLDDKKKVLKIVDNFISKVL